MRGILEISKSTHVHQMEMQYVVEQYIKEKKGVDISVALDVTSIIGRMTIQSQLNKLTHAFNVASAYFISK
tara:strand:+ start:3668 stop:3880 length:213 start_codon:yes stop_codon:yes gene_type:complete